MKGVVPVVVAVVEPLVVPPVVSVVVCVVDVVSVVAVAMDVPVSLVPCGGAVEQAKHPSVIQRNIVLPYVPFDYSLLGVSGALCLARMGVQRSREVANAKCSFGYNDGLGVRLW